MKVNRRHFLAHGAAAGAAALAIQRFGLINALAQSGGYRALVCVFLFGGNDSNNMIVPVDDYAAYQAVRGARAGSTSRWMICCGSPAERRRHVRSASRSRRAASALESGPAWPPSATSVRWSSR